MNGKENEDTSVKVTPIKPLSTTTPDEMLAKFKADLPTIELIYGSFASYRLVTQWQPNNKIYDAADKIIQPILVKPADQLTLKELEDFTGAFIAVAQEFTKDQLNQIAGQIPFPQTLSLILAGIGLLGGV